MAELKELLPGGGKPDVNKVIGSGSGATNTIFGDAGKENARPSKKNGHEPNKDIQLKEFFWDQFSIYIATGIALLTVLNASIQFFQSTGNLQCYVPMDVLPQEFTRDNAAYVNSFCLNSLTWSEYYSVFVLIQGILLVAPHYLWSSIFSGRFDFFVDLVKQLDRLRDSNTGDYRPENIYIVKKLEQEFPEKWKWGGIFFLYIIKLIAQLLMILISLAVNISIFPEKDFSSVFLCPRDFNGSKVDGWSFPAAVSCSYPSFRVLSRIQIVDYILLVFMSGSVMYGLFWCAKRHPSSLGYRQVAEFSFSSCLAPEEYISKPVWKAPICPRITNDLDFLVMRLFRADSGHGRVFKDIQVFKEIKSQITDDHISLHLLKDAIDDQNKAELQGSRCIWCYKAAIYTFPEGTDTDRDQDIQDFLHNAGFDKHPPIKVYRKYMKFKGDRLGKMEFDPVGSLRNRLFTFFQFSPKNELAYDISFGTIGYSLILARGFKEVISVNFHPFYHNAEEVVKKEMFQVSYSSVTVQQNIFAQRAENLGKTDRVIDDFFRDEKHKRMKDKKISLIVVGPFVQEATRRTVNLHIERMNNAVYFGKNTVLLAVRPVKIAGKNVSKHFYKYEPAKQLFSLMTNVDDVLKMAFPYTKGLVPVTCASIDCIFEFTMYSFLRGQEEIDRLSKSPAFPLRSKNSRMQSTASAHSTDTESSDSAANLVQSPLAGADHDIKDNRVRVNLRSSQNTHIDIDESGPQATEATVSESHSTQSAET